MFDRIPGENMVLWDWDWGFQFPDYIFCLLLPFIDLPADERELSLAHQLVCSVVFGTIFMKVQILPSFQRLRHLGPKPISGIHIILLRKQSRKDCKPQGIFPVHEPYAILFSQ